MISRTGNATGDEKKMISNVIPFPSKAKIRFCQDSTRDHLDIPNSSSWIMIRCLALSVVLAGYLHHSPILDGCY